MLFLGYEMDYYIFDCKGIKRAWADDLEKHWGDKYLYKKQVVKDLDESEWEFISKKWKEFRHDEEKE